MNLVMPNNTGMVVKVLPRLHRWTAPILVLFLAVFTRLAFLGKQSLFLDEAWSWGAARLSAAQLLQLPATDPHPTLYYFLLKGVLAFVPATEAGLRLLSALCSLAGIAVILWFVGRRWGSRSAVIGGLFAALSSFDLYYAQEARMYTLLGLLWLLSYAFLLEAVERHPRWFLLWGVTCALMCWTHLYGLLATGVELIFALGVYLRPVGRKCGVPIDGRWLAAGVGAALAGALPVALMLWQHRSGSAGGAWVPKPEDALGFFVLVSGGLSAARQYFLDGAHLVLPVLAGVPLWVWTLAGVAFGGIFCLRGLWQERKNGYAAALAGVMLFIPALPFTYAFLFQRQQWAFKPLLGVAYLFYLWAGIGLSRARTGVRWAAVAGIFVLSLASWIPYTTTWQKSDAAAAFQSMPPANDFQMLLVHPAYLAPLAFYYRPGEPVWGLWGGADKPFTFNLVSADGVLWDGYNPVDCDNFGFALYREAWVYGSPQPLRVEQAIWPQCLAAKQVFLFEDGQWVLINP